jgi:hypothetical protein
MEGMVTHHMLCFVSFRSKQHAFFFSMHSKSKGVTQENVLDAKPFTTTKKSLSSKEISCDFEKK